LPPEIEDRFNQKWHDWINEADLWDPVFNTIQNISGLDLPDLLLKLDLATHQQIEMVKKLNRSAEETYAAFRNWDLAASFKSNIANMGTWNTIGATNEKWLREITATLSSRFADNESIEPQSFWPGADWPLINGDHACFGISEEPIIFITNLQPNGCMTDIRMAHTSF
jgi:hypothetical protein